MPAASPSLTADYTASSRWSAMAPWCWLLLYFGLHVAMRTLVSPALELDEAEQALWAQQLQWGYGAQPPLYTWLQWGVFQLFGVSVLALSLLKNGLLALAYVCVFLGARRLMPAGLAALAAAGMLLLPQIGWESSRDLTHSVLLTSCAAATLAVVLALLQRPTGLRYLLLGLVAGLGLLSKYSYAAFLAALLVAVLAGRDTRAVLLDRRALAAAALASALVLPHGLWLLQHWQAATAGTVAKLAEGGPATGRGAALAQGLVSLVLAVAAFAAPWALAMAALFGRGLRARWGRAGHQPALGWDVAAFWYRYGLALGLLFLSMLLFGGATHFKDRWMMPFLFLLPLAFFSCAPALARHPRLPLLRHVLVATAVLVLVLLTARVPYHARQQRPNELNQPVAALAQTLRAHGYAGRGAILASDRALGGSLRLQFPRARVSVAEPGQALPAVRPLLVVERTPAPPAADAPPWKHLRLPYLYADGTAAPAHYRYRQVD